GTAESRYMRTEAMLASEKLEDLNRYPSNDPSVAAPGGVAGSLTADQSQSVTVGAVTENVDYFDTVQLSSGNGSISEVVTGTDAGGAPNYTNVNHKPDSTVTSITVYVTQPVSTEDMLVYKHNWLIMQDFWL